jgi:hypothetical protein
VVTVELEVATSGSRKGAAVTVELPTASGAGHDRRVGTVDRAGSRGLRGDHEIEVTVSLRTPTRRR